MHAAAAQAMLLEISIQRFPHRVKFLLPAECDVRALPLSQLAQAVPCGGQFRSQLVQRANIAKAV